MPIQHKLKVSDDKHITITEPTGAQTSMLVTNAKIASQNGDFDQQEQITNWIVDKCVDAKEYQALQSFEQLKVVNAIMEMGLGQFDPKS